MGIISDLPLPSNNVVIVPSAILKWAKREPGSALLTFIALAVAYLVFSYKSKKQRIVADIPIIGGEDQASVLKSRRRFIHDGMAMLQEGYSRYKNGFFYVPSKLGERLMLPTRYLEDLKTAPIDKVDFVATFQEMFEGKYTTMGSRSTLHPRVVKAQLNQHLAEVMPDVQDEIRNAFEEDWPNCDEWTEVPVVACITQIVARVSSRMFGGATLSENKEWIASSIAFALDGFEGAQAIKQYPHFLRPVAQWFIPALRRIREHYKAAERAAIPLLEQRERDGETALDLLYWMSDQAKNEERDKAFIAGILLKVSFAAIHTSAAAPSQLLFDLCAMPEYQEPLRREMESVVNPDTGKIDGKQGYLKLSKLDSIMKESQRFNPLLLITFERVITEDYPLSDGFVIPANTTIGIPTQAITMDPEHYSDPETFDAFRFEKIRSSASTSPNEAGKAVFAASNPQSMAFGYGRHACPGRFFAANEIKAIMVYLLMNFDMKYPGAKEGMSSEELKALRPKSLLFETQNLPNHEAKIMFRRRKPSAD